MEFPAKTVRDKNVPSTEPEREALPVEAAEGTEGLGFLKEQWNARRRDHKRAGVISHHNTPETEHNLSIRISNTMTP